MKGGWKGNRREEWLEMVATMKERVFRENQERRGGCRADKRKG